MRAGDFYSYAIERERIRLRKAAGESWPWTRNEILRTYKFTNVRREHDATSVALRKIYEQHQHAPREQVLLNCALARYFGTAEWTQAAGWQRDFTSRTRERLEGLAEIRLSGGLRVFTGAYIVPNCGYEEPKHQFVLRRCIKEMWDCRHVVLSHMHAGSWQVTIEHLCRLMGWGPFMAKEVTLDTMYFSSTWAHSDACTGGALRSVPLDYWTWTPIGPGALRGLARVFAKPRRQVGLEDLLLLHDAQGEHWPPQWGRLAPTDVQFALCEFDKFERVRLGEGKPRSLYKRKQCAS